jgi:transcriptional regulator with XRE-family HTH domain
MKMNLKYWRQKRALAIRDLAAKSGVSTSTIIDVEKTERLPKPNVIRRLATALDIEVSELLVDGEPEPMTGYVSLKKENGLMVASAVVSQ